ncbi:MAG TPA: 3-carboxy-cis,cis-muconate cycloisomerase [Xanthobacteraceae bacterium]|nr:3-carboxy-cis,cis-muconate cycloisomerase [Xanthobacteraceae bacterium]
MLDPLGSSLLGPLFASATMRALLADRERLQRMLDVEAALARAEAAVGVIPQQAVASIVAACRAEHYDLAALGDAAVDAGNVAIPLVKALTAEVGKKDKEAARYVHWGATSQDIIDTALVLDLRAAIDALRADLDRAIAGFAALAERHRHVAAAGRTWLQQALPIPLGLKFAGYAAALGRSRARLVRLRTEALVLQFGGAAGTLAALEHDGLKAAERMAAELALGVPDAPWHSHRDRLAELAAALAILAGTCGKIARDVALLMQTEVAEAFEPAAEGRGGSSTMPQKRNPVGAVAALAAVTVAANLAATILNAQVHEHERATGAWQAEWPVYPALALVTSGALHAVADIAEGLTIDAERMRQNLDATGGQIMAEAVTFALARKLGKQEAHHRMEAAAKKARNEKRHLKDALTADAGVTQHLKPAEIEDLFDPLAYQGVAQAFIDRLIASTRS